MTPSALKSATRALAPYRLSIASVDGDEMAWIACDKGGCDCRYQVVLARYLALPKNEIGCPKCSPNPFRHAGDAGENIIDRLGLSLREPDLTDTK